MSDAKVSSGLDRRHFLGAGCALFAASQLPAAIEDDSKVFAETGGWSVPAISYARIHLGLRQPFNVTHLTDSHISDAHPDEPEDLTSCAASRHRQFCGYQRVALACSLAWAKGKACPYVVHTGDLIDFQSRANLETAKEFVSGNPELAVAMGNHEFWRRKTKAVPETRAVSEPDLKAAFGPDIGFRSKVIRNVNFILLDDVYGTVSTEQVKLFEREVAKGLPIVLCMHVPVFTETIEMTARRFWGNVPDIAMQRDDATTRDFLAYLKTEKLLRAMLTGHLHYDIEERFSDTCVQYVTGANFMFRARLVLFT